ncbi:retrotransposon protein [Hordeum vulgare]|nr:retrotransposon protein [Hordeum vulgare]
MLPGTREYVQKDRHPRLHPFRATNRAETVSMLAIDLFISVYIAGVRRRLPRLQSTSGLPNLAIELVGAGVDRVGTLDLVARIACGRGGSAGRERMDVGSSTAMALVPYSGGCGTTMATLVPMLTGANYTTWAIKVEADLDAAGLWEAVVPLEEAASAVIAKKDKPARAYLLRALADDLLLQVPSKKTAAEIWASLRTRFVGADRVRAARLGTLRGSSSSCAWRSSKP